jgi:NADH:ubiquinone oxidoreductase subunit 5 (subunit L)/multisubunit Na+/H+ antiporter MnhA subunit
MWAPDVYDGSPTPIAGFMATGVKAAGFLALARILYEAFPGASETWQPVVAALAVASMVLGNLVALAQRSLKRMLAYSSVAHAGYLLTALWPGSRLGASATLLYLAAYAVTSLAAFGILGVLGRGGERDVTLDSVAGLARRRPWLAAALAVCMLSLLGFPGTLGFVGKWAILAALVEAKQWAEASVDCTLCVMSRTDVESLIATKPGFAIAMMETLGRRLHDVEATFEQFAFRNVHSRVASLLLSVSDPEGNIVGLSHQDLAERVGTHRETVTRALNEFRAAGAIELGRARIKILDRAQLVAASEAE